MITKPTKEFLEIEEEMQLFLKEQFKNVFKPRMIVETTDNGNTVVWFVSEMHFKPKPPCEYMIRPKLVTRKKVDELKKYFNQLKEKGEIAYYVSTDFGSARKIKVIWKSEIDNKKYKIK